MLFKDFLEIAQDFFDSEHNAYDKDWEFLHHIDSRFINFIEEKSGIKTEVSQVHEDEEYDGRVCQSVQHFKQLGLYVAINYTYSSWNTNYYEEKPYEVSPKQKIVTFWE